MPELLGTSPNRIRLVEGRDCLYCGSVLFRTRVTDGCILIVEDDPQLAMMIAEYIRECGYETLEAANADEAISLLRSGIAQVDIVFSDVAMPGAMDGCALVRWVRQNYPLTEVLLTSGCVGGIQSDGLHDVQLLEKPYKLDDLKRALSALKKRG
jgi:CheY-like chemotaxis protein